MVVSVRLEEKVDSDRTPRLFSLEGVPGDSSWVSERHPRARPWPDR